MVFVDPVEFLRVPEAEFARHLGYPDETIPDGRSREVADGARRWFEENAKPWYATRVVAIDRVDEAFVTLETGTQFESEVLAGRLRDSQCHAVLIVAVSAGSEVDEAVRQCWDTDRPDDAYALNAFAATATEQLLLAAGKLLCAEAEADGNTLLQHYSPGYSGWAIEEQPLVMSLLKATNQGIQLDLLESGLLTPQKSMLAVFGITAHLELVPPALVPCTTCALPDCTLRRLPYAGSSAAPDAGSCAPETPKPNADVPPARNDGYAFPRKALKRWKNQLLDLDRGDNGHVRARFVYNGSTCSDGGIPLAFVYEVALETVDGEFVIREMHCQPQAGDAGHRETCSYVANPRNARSHYESFKPLLGSPLASAVSWNPPRNPAGCLCTPANRNHKWLMALQTIHFALHGSGTASRAEASHSGEPQ